MTRVKFCKNEVVRQRLQVRPMLPIITMLLVLLMLQAGGHLFAQDARSNRVGFMLNNVPDTLPPVIRILSPELNGSMNIQSGKNRVQLIGEVKDDRMIRFVAVNSIKKAIGKDGRFTADIDLYPGKNEVRLVAADGENNLEEQFLLIEYLPPVANHKKAQ